MNFNLLIDGSYYMNKAYFVSYNEDETFHFQKTCVSFMYMIRKLIYTYKPTKTIVVWDGEENTDVRLKVYKDYKANRSREDKERYIIDQSKHVCYDILDELNILQILSHGYEADDAVGFISRNLEGKTLILSGDEVFAQLINEKVEFYLDNKKKYVKPNNFNDSFPFIKQNYLLFKAIDGKVSDNIKGVKGFSYNRLLKFFPNMSNEEYNIDRLMIEAKEYNKKSKLLDRLIESRTLIENNMFLLSLDDEKINKTERNAIYNVIANEETKTIKEKNILKQLNEYELINLLKGSDNSRLGNFIEPFINN